MDHRVKARLKLRWDVVNQLLEHPEVSLTLEKK